MLNSSQRGRRSKTALVALVLLGATLGGCASVLLRRAPTVTDGARQIPADVQLTVDGRPIRVLALQTGTVTITECHREGCFPDGTPYPLRFLSMLLDDDFTAPMPILSYVIVHPEGVFVVDAGATSDFDDEASWRCDENGSRAAHALIDLDTRPGESLREQLEARGIDAPRAVVLTHQHVDHTGGLRRFPGVDVWTGQGDVESASDIGAFPCRFASDVRMRTVEDAAEPSGASLGPGVALTEDESLRVYSTPGHTPGSLTAALRTDQGTLWFIGDLAFTEANFHPDAPTAGIHTDPDAVRRWQRTLGRLAQPGEVFPAHDPDAPERLRALSQRTLAARGPA